MVTLRGEHSYIWPQYGVRIGRSSNYSCERLTQITREWTCSWIEVGTQDTPLHYAAMAANNGAVKMLLVDKANFWAKAGSAKTTP